MLNSKVLPKFGYYVPALTAMEPDREPHPNSTIDKQEIQFMKNIINGKYTVSHYIWVTIRYFSKTRKYRTIPIRNEENNRK